jgi:hypothetical protein
VTARLGFPRRQLRADLRDWTRESRAFLLAMLGLGLAVLMVGIALTTLWPSANDFLQGLITGGVIAAIVAMSIWAFLTTTGSQNRLVGALAEGSTKAELKAAAKAGEIHGYVAHIELSGYDVDSLAVTASGVLAIETKWRRVNPSARQLGRDVESALRATATTRSILRSLGEADVPVHGLLVIWGPDSGGLVTDRGGVHVVSGDRLLEALRHTAWGRALNAGDGTRLTEKIEDFADAHGPHAQVG